MTLSKLTLCLATLALGIASAATYPITLPSDLKAGNTQLKAGDYKVQLEGDQAVFKQGKETIQVPVTVEQNATTYRYTTMEASSSALQSITLGGTKTKLVVKSAGKSGVASNTH